MKNYDERIKSIQKKARGMKAARFAIGSGITAACLTAIVLCATLLVPYVVSQVDSVFGPILGLIDQLSTRPDHTVTTQPPSLAEPTQPTEHTEPPHIHQWVDATCVLPRICIICGETEVAALGHSWIPGNCTMPKTCMI